MTPHIHVSLLSFLITGCYVVIWNFLWRALAARMRDNAAGKAMFAIGG